MAGLTKDQIDAWSKRNQQAFKGILDVNQFIPGSGDVQSGIMAANDVNQGNYGSAALNALGLLPFIPSLGGIIKGANVKPIASNIDEYKTMIGNTALEFHHYKPENTIDITRISTPISYRGKGEARNAMETLLKETDAKGIATELVPTPMDKFTKPEKLKDFYRSLGYVDSQYGMIRYPKK